VNSSGMLWSDGLIVSLVLYSVFYGWAATLVGWTICLFVGIAHRRWRAAAGCALLGLLPALYMLALVLLASAPDRNITHLSGSDTALLVVSSGMALAILACPVAAAILAWRGFRARSHIELRNAR
jgi:hypothetical protein